MKKNVKPFLQNFDNNNNNNNNSTHENIDNIA